VLRPPKVRGLVDDDLGRIRHLVEPDAGTRVARDELRRAGGDQFLALAVQVDEQPVLLVRHGDRAAVGQRERPAHVLGIILAQVSVRGPDLHGGEAAGGHGRRDGRVGKRGQRDGGGADEREDWKDTHDCSGIKIRNIEWTFRALPKESPGA
jgi:hypothetical protein